MCDYNQNYIICLKEQIWYLKEELNKKMILLSNWIEHNNKTLDCFIIHNKHSCSHNKQETVIENCLNVSSDETPEVTTIPTFLPTQLNSFTHIDDRNVTKRETYCWARSSSNF